MNHPFAIRKLLLKDSNETNSEFLVTALKDFYDVLRVFRQKLYGTKEKETSLRFCARYSFPFLFIRETVLQVNLRW